MLQDAGILAVVPRAWLLGEFHNLQVKFMQGNVHRAI